MSKLEFVARTNSASRWVFCLESNGDSELAVRVNKEISLEHIHDWLRQYCLDEVGQPISEAEDSLVKAVLAALSTWEARAPVDNREAVMGRLDTKAEPCDLILREDEDGEDEDGNAVDAERETVAS